MFEDPLGFSEKPVVTAKHQHHNSGGNVLYLDGHVSWLTFDQMRRYCEENESGIAQMKRLLIVASIAHLLLLSQLRDSCAAGSYDGEWTGSATSSTGGRCRPANVTLTVQGKVVTGRAKFEIDAASISGTVSEDGTFGATIGFQPLTGEFMQDQFKGTFKNGDCVWNLVLRRTKQ